MHERTFLAAMIGLDVMLMLAGGAMAWGRATPPSTAVMAVLSTALIAGIGAFVLYQLNSWVFELAESGAAVRAPRLVAVGFVVVTVLGGMAGLAL